MDALEVCSVIALSLVIHFCHRVAGSYSVSCHAVGSVRTYHCRSSTLSPQTGHREVYFPHISRDSGAYLDVPCPSFHYRQVGSSWFRRTWLWLLNLNLYLGLLVILYLNLAFELELVLWLFSVVVCLYYNLAFECEHVHLHVFVVYLLESLDFNDTLMTVGM